MAEGKAHSSNSVQKVKKTTGIPKTFLKPAANLQNSESNAFNRDDPRQIMLNPEGGFVTVQSNE